MFTTGEHWTPTGCGHKDYTVQYHRGTVLTLVLYRLQHPLCSTLASASAFRVETINAVYLISASLSPSSSSFSSSPTYSLCLPTEAVICGLLVAYQYLTLSSTLAVERHGVVYSRCVFPLDLVRLEQSEAPPMRYKLHVVG